MEGIIKKKKCPLCGSRKISNSITVPLKYFAYTNKTYNPNKLSKFMTSLSDTEVLISCANCKFVFSKYELPENLTKYLYEEVIDPKKSLAKIETEAKKNEIKYVYKIITSLVIDKNSKILDFGCGWGELITFLKNSGYTNCFGFDVSKKRGVRVASKGVSFLSSIETIANNAPFDLIIAHQFLEHDPRFMETLRNLHSFLDSRGYLYISVPNTSNSFGFDQNKNIAIKSIPDKNINPWEHVNYFTPETLKMALEKSRFAAYDAANKKVISTLVSTTCFAKKN